MSSKRPSIPVSENRRSWEPSSRDVQRTRRGEAGVEGAVDPDVGQAAVRQPGRLPDSDARVDAADVHLVVVAAVRPDETDDGGVGGVVLVDDPPPVRGDLCVDVALAGDHRGEAAGVAAVGAGDHQVVTGIGPVGPHDDPAGDGAPPVEAEADAGADAQIAAVSTETVASPRARRRRRACTDVRRPVVVRRVCPWTRPLRRGTAPSRAGR